MSVRNLRSLSGVDAASEQPIPPVSLPARVGIRRDGDDKLDASDAFIQLSQDVGFIMLGRERTGFLPSTQPSRGLDAFHSSSLMRQGCHL